MAARRRHDPKGLGSRLGSKALLKQGRANKRRGGGSAQPKTRSTSVSPAPRRRTPKKKKAAPKGPGLLARWFARLPSGPMPRTRSEADELAAVRRRVTLVLAMLGLAAAVLVGRAAQLQLLEGEAYERVAEGQATASALIKAKRGVIRDRQGDELAITVDVDAVFAHPRQVKDPAAAAAKLAPVLGKKKAWLQKELSMDKSFRYLARGTTAEAARQVRALGIRGIGTLPEPKRFYANVGLAAHVLGFVNRDGEGRAGIERTFDEDLQGSSMRLPSLRDALGNRVFSEGLVPDSALEGAEVTLTLDRQIQYAAEKALEEAVIDSRAEHGAAVVLDPKNGDVLALASYPTYNPNNLAGTTRTHRWNRAIAATLEPGSTAKIVTIAAALEEKLVGATDKVDCEDGAWRFGGRTIHDDTHRYAELSITEILQKSSNICSAKIGVKLGRQRLHQWLRKFGFREKTGIELPGEVRGQMRNPERWSDIGLANIAFGQGFSVTPLQIAQAAATLANGGVRHRPRLVRSVVGKDGPVALPPRPDGIRVVSERTARLVTEMMTEVTNRGGTAPKAAIEGFAVAGKTGTAQKIDPVTKAYSHRLYTASFVGFVPADRPEVVVLVVVDEPKASKYGGVVAAPAFKKIALAALAARNRFPEAPKDRAALAAYRAPPPVATPGEAGAGAAPASDEKWMDSEEIADMPGLDAALARGLSEDAQALLGLTAGVGTEGDSTEGRRRMPNFAGLSLHEVLNRSADVRCDPVVKGTGRVVAQSPKAGVPIEAGAPCTLTLAPGGRGRGSG